MANHASTRKAVRKTATVTLINKSRKNRIRTYIKKVLAAVASGNKEEASIAFVTAQSEIMKGVSRNLLNKNTGARKVSRLAAKVKAIQSA